MAAPAIIVPVSGTGRDSKNSGLPSSRALPGATHCSQGQPAPAAQRVMSAWMPMMMPMMMPPWMPMFGKLPVPATTSCPARSRLDLRADLRTMPHGRCASYRHDAKHQGGRSDATNTDARAHASHGTQQQEAAVIQDSCNSTARPERSCRVCSSPCSTSCQACATSSSSGCTSSSSTSSSRR
jgi:hypothetical protein